MLSDTGDLDQLFAGNFSLSNRAVACSIKQASATSFKSNESLQETGSEHQYISNTGTRHDPSLIESM